MGGIGQESVKIIVALLLDFLRLTTLARRQALARKRARLVYRLRLSIPPAKSSLFASHLQSIKKKHLFKEALLFYGGDGGYRTPVQTWFASGSTRCRLFFGFEPIVFETNKTTISRVSSILERLMKRSDAPVR